MIKPELDYRQLRSEILKEPGVVDKAEGYFSDGSVVLGQRHKVVLAMKKAMPLRDEITIRGLTAVMRDDDSYVAVERPIFVCPEWRVLPLVRNAESRMFEARRIGKRMDPLDKLLVKWYLAERLEHEMFSAYVAGPALLSNKLGRTFSAKLLKILGYDQLFAGTYFDTTPEALLYELGTNAVSHGTDYGKNGAVKVEWFGRKEQVLVGFTQPGEFNLRKALAGAKSRPARPKVENATEWNYVNEACRLRGNGFKNFVKCPFAINASYYPDADTTTTFMHVRV
ncbi:MAG: hypothetical protein WC897_02845 [Candidatus Gracilibacteria bacterium]